ncbi:UNVERIFIED_CONTAM: hypothetical protein K2H54_064940 [Gekko kuhli]
MSNEEEPVVLVTTDAQMAPRWEPVDEGAWEECLARIELGQANMTHMLEEALMDIPRLVAPVVQGELLLQ